MGKGLLRGGDKGRQKKNRAGLFIYEVIFPLIKERETQAAYCLSLMNNMNECEKEKKCKEQRRLQTRLINMKTKTVCPVHLTSKLKNQHFVLGKRIAAHLVVFQICNVFLLKAKCSQPIHTYSLSLTHTQRVWFCLQ